jgi:Stress responsive A/B Barrel Domain
MGGSPVPYPFLIQEARMIRHCVFLRFKNDISEETIDGFLADFLLMKNIIPGVKDVAAGRNNSREGLDHGFRHGFTMDLENEAAREAYLSHSSRSALAERVLPCLEGGIDGVMVADITI